MLGEHAKDGLHKVFLHHGLYKIQLFYKKL